MAKPTLPPREARIVDSLPPVSASVTAGLRAARRTPWYRPAVALYDWSYRRLRRLDQPAARIEPVLRVQRCRRWRALRLADGTRLGRGATFGVLHLDNVRALALHGAGRDPVMIGFEFRRLFLTSLRALAARATDSGPLALFEAYSVTTLFHHRLPILGFAPAPGDQPICRHVVSLYERALLSSLHPAGPARLRSGARREVRRLWISRQDLLARFGISPGEQPSRLQSAITPQL
jgi:hypothetical protein